MRMRLPPTLALALVMVAILASPVAAHSELATSMPADGAVVTGSPAEVVGDFTEAVDPARSSMELRGPDGASIAVGGVPEGGPATRMTIALPPLASGTYEVRWTTVTPDDAGVERGTFSFVVEAATPAPTATAAPGATPDRATAAPTMAPTPAPAPGDGTAAGGLGDLLVPLVALGVVLALGAAWILRRR